MGLSHGAADETGQVGIGYAPSTSLLLRFLTLTINCHLAQDTLLYFAANNNNRPCPTAILVADSSLSLEASLRGVLCRVARW